jgi:hypothetical protein
MFLAITAIGWGLTWPVNKFLLSELPPLTLRGGTALARVGFNSACGIPICCP